MASTELDELRGKLDARISELEKTQKQLKHPSTISFAERRELSANAGKALTELREQQASLGSGAEGSEDAAAKTTEAEAALERAAAVLGSVTAAQPAGAKRATGAGDRRLPGQQRRGAAGASQQRAPERKGGE